MEQASIQGLVSHAETHHRQTVIRSGHSPELPMDPVEFSMYGFPQPMPFPANDASLALGSEPDDKLQEAATHAAYIQGLNEGLQEAHAAYKKGFDTGNKNTTAWAFGGAAFGVIIMMMWVAAFPDAASLIMRVPAPDQLPPMAVATSGR